MPGAVDSSGNRPRIPAAHRGGLIPPNFLHLPIWGNGHHRPPTWVLLAPSPRVLGGSLVVLLEASNSETPSPHAWGQELAWRGRSRIPAPLSKQSLPSTPPTSPCTTGSLSPSTDTQPTPGRLLPPLMSTHGIWCFLVENGYQIHVFPAFNHRALGQPTCWAAVPRRVHLPAVNSRH